MLRNGVAASAGAFRYFVRTPAGVYVVALVLPALAVVVALLAGVGPADLFRDPLTTAGIPIEQFYLGFFSSMGVVTWAAAGSICVFTAATESAKLDPHDRAFLLYAGILTLVIMVDDLYMIHENLVNVPAQIMYIAAVMFYMYLFFTVILRLDVILFIMSIGLLGSSVAVDQLADIINTNASFASEKDVIRGKVDGLVSSSNRRDLLYLVEDGPKFLGVCAWAAFHVRAAYLLRRQ